MNKKGQLTIFIIFSVLIVIVIGLLFFIEVLKEERNLEESDKNFESEKISLEYEEVRQCLYSLVEGMGDSGKFNERVVEEYLAVNSYICFDGENGVNVKVNPPFKVEVNEGEENFYFQIKLNSEFESDGVVSTVEEYSVEVAKDSEDEPNIVTENISFIDGDERVSYIDREFGVNSEEMLEFIVEYKYSPEDIFEYELFIDFLNITSREFLFSDDELYELSMDPKLFEIVLNHSYDEIFRINNSNYSYEEIRDTFLLFDFVENISRNNEYQLLDYVEVYSFTDKSFNINDEFFRRQWYLENRGQFYGRRGADINILPAWEVTKGKSEVIVAVIDQGVFNNLDYEEKISKKSFNFVDYSKNVFTRNEYEYHGSHVTGVISSETNNEFGIAGICPECSIMVLKVADSKGKIDSTVLTKAIVYAVNNGAKIISLSLGGEKYSAYEEGLFERLSRRGVVFVAAAGNDGTKEKTYPAAYKSVISVGASDNLDKRAYFSNYGTWVDIFAPGRMILSVCGRDKYCFDSGTSMATPIVSGVIGLILSLDSDLTADEISKMLTTSGKKIEFGSYRIDAGKTISEMVEEVSLNESVEEFNESFVIEKIAEVIEKRRIIVENRELLRKSFEVHESFVNLELDELLKYCSENVEICKDYCTFFERDDTACDFIGLFD